MKQALQFVDEDDGTFWMDFEDFKLYFGRLYLCKTVVGNVFSHIALQQEPENYTILRVSVPADGNYTFSGVWFWIRHHYIPTITLFFSFTEVASLFSKKYRLQVYEATCLNRI